MSVIVASAPAAAVYAIPAGAATAAFTVIPGEPGAGTQVNLNIPGSNKLNGVPFKVRAAGYLTIPAQALSPTTIASAATPISFTLCGSNTASFAAAVANLIFTATAIATFTVTTTTVSQSFPWVIEASFVGGGSGLAGAGYSIQQQPGGIITALSNDFVVAVQPTGTPFNWAAEPPVQFAVIVTTAASNLIGGTVGGTVTLSQFVCEA